MLAEPTDLIFEKLAFGELVKQPLGCWPRLYNHSCLLFSHNVKKHIERSEREQECMSLTKPNI